MIDKLYACEECMDARTPFAASGAYFPVSASLSSSRPFGSSFGTPWIFQTDVDAEMHVMETGHRVYEFNRGNGQMERAGTIDKPEIKFVLPADDLRRQVDEVRVTVGGKKLPPMRRHR